MAERDVATTPLFTLHREMNRLFDDVFRGFDSPTLWSGRGAWPQLEVQDTDTEYRVSAELPGLEEKDIEILVEDGVLVLRGEKRAETDDRGRAFSERFYGRFERRLVLGDIDEGSDPGPVPQWRVDPDRPQIGTQPVAGKADSDQHSDHQPLIL